MAIVVAVEVNRGKIVANSNLDTCALEIGPDAFLNRVWSSFSDSRKSWIGWALGFLLDNELTFGYKEVYVTSVQNIFFNFRSSIGPDLTGPSAFCPAQPF